MIIWGWGKVTKKIIGGVKQYSCSHCNQAHVWNLCIVRTWFTLFFIPIIPYRVSYQVSCPNCGSYIELDKEKFDELKTIIENSSSVEEVEDNIKYQGKTQTQINYLKHMEEYERNKDN